MADVLDKSKTQETILLDKLTRIEENPAGYFAVHMHLSELRPSNRQPHFISIAARAFDNLVNGADAVIYDMMNQDLVLVCHDVLVEDIDPYISKVKTLFNEDPLTLDEDEYEDQFSTWYDLSSREDFAAFLSAITELSVYAENKIEEIKKTTAEQEGHGSGDPLTAKNLAAINQKLHSTRIADLIRQQACVRIAPGKAGEMVFHEHFIAMAELKDRVSPGVNLFTSPWLFQYLTETLDKRMLAVIGRKNFAEVKDPISINLNIATALSRDFAVFNKAVGDQAKKLVIEFQIIDIFSDMNTYGYARDMLQDRGYRVLVDGVNPLSLQFFDPATLRPDFIKIGWGKEFEQETDNESRLATFKQTVKHAGPDSVILSRVDTEKAVKWGLALGISRFQGYFIDKLVMAMTKSRVKPRAKPSAKQGAA